MQSQDLEQKNIGVLRNILVVVLVVFVGILVYMLTQTQPDTDGTDTIAVASPEITEPTVQDPYAEYDTFNDGLQNPNIAQFNETDEYGVGVTSLKIYNHDLNEDGRPDRITRTHFENGTSHFTNEYKIEIATDNGYVDITPEDGLKTVEGADCAIQKIRFSFRPIFQIEIIGRDILDDYITPTMAYRTVYRLQNDNLIAIDYEPLVEVCDVADLFKNDSSRAE